MLKNVGLAILCSIAFIACKKDAKKIEAIDPIEEVIEPVNDFKEVLGYKVGDVATDFNLLGTDNQKHSLTDFAEAKGYIVIFTCNHCPYAQAYEERIVALDQKYKGLGYPVIAINPNDPVVQPEDGLELMKVRAKEKGFTFPYLLDEGQKIYPQYGATKTPHVFILQKEGGKNIVKYIGAIDDNYEDASQVSEKYVEKAVDALLAGKKIEQTQTVAIGCSIKVKK
ncbi:thioredoxin family protein [Myroides sp. 1354]|uniref:thioredoxin family protein n=1 Tax=unclassified Myroides TaxID=2642485 RepID=UPI002575FF9C|nr:MULTISPECIES: thioredoxin family protein [unclassified Myroides]MDM1046159.1 thioredoxin family protein [Myroides sp. R163-1]MDM1057125.1 thioredoxin family protein [Myroides sp. 1354]MDM1070290.1 thioredoxin family protein [Myroides sp. 1372]